MITFSIIIPVYNRADKLKRTLEAIVQQSYGNWEAIVVDDGSDDCASEFVVNSFNDDRIKYIRKDNEERSIARNVGVRMAVGRYVMPLDSDDLIAPWHLLAVHEAIIDVGEVELFHTTYVIIEQESGVSRTCSLSARNASDVLATMMRENCLAIGAGFIRRDVALSLSFPESRHAIHGEDWLFYIRLIVRYGINIVESNSFTYLVHNKSSIKNIDADKFERSYNIILEILKDDEIVRQKVGTKAFKMLLAHQVAGVALQHLLCAHPNRLRAAQNLWKAFKIAPEIIVSRRGLVCAKLLVLKRMVSGS